MLNHQRRLTLPRSTAAPTATQLRLVVTLHLLLLQEFASALRAHVVNSSGGDDGGGVEVGEADLTSSRETRAVLLRGAMNNIHWGGSRSRALVSAMCRSEKTTNF